MNAAVETEPDRMVVFQPRSSLVVNLSADETTSAGAHKAAYRVATKQAGRLAEALQEEHITRAVLGFGNFAGVWCAVARHGIGLQPDALMRPLNEHQGLPEMFTLGGQLVYDRDAAVVVRVHELGFEGSVWHRMSAADAHPTAVLMTNALNNNMMLNNDMLLRNGRSIARARHMQEVFTRWHSRFGSAMRKATEAAADSSGCDGIGGLLPQYRMVRGGLDAFARVMNEELEVMQDGG